MISNRETSPVDFRLFNLPPKHDNTPGLSKAHGGNPMSKTKSPPKFKVGDAVRVKLDVADPDYDDLPIGGRAGTISEIEHSNPPLYLIRWNQESRSPGAVVE